MSTGTPIRVLSFAEVVVDLPAAVWTPRRAYQWTDFPAQHGHWYYTGESTDGQLVVEPHLHCVRLKEYELPTEPITQFRTAPHDPDAPTLTVEHSTSITPYSTVPGIGTLYELTIGGQRYLHWYEPLTPHKAHALMCERAESVPARGIRWLHTTLNRRGIVCRWLYEPMERETPTGSVPTLRYCFGFRESDEDTLYNWYAVQISTQTNPQILMTRASETDIKNDTNLVWQPVRSAQSAGNQTNLSASLDPYREEPRPAGVLHSLRALCIGGRLVLEFEHATAPLIIPLIRPRSINDYSEETQDEPYVPEPLPHDRVIERLHVRWTDARAIHLALAPLWYARSGKMESEPVNVGYTGTDAFEPRIRYALPKPDATEATVTTEDSANGALRYTLELKHTNSAQHRTLPDGTTVAPDTPLVRAIDFVADGTTEPTLHDPLLLNPNELHIAWQLELARMQMHSSATLTYADPDGTLGYLLQNTGHRAVTITLGRAVYDAAGNILPPGHPEYGSVPWTPVFTGYFNTQMRSQTNAGGTLMTTVQCSDRSIQLRHPRWWLAWMDGWNIYYAMDYLAQLGGIDRSQLGFRDSIPTDPFEPSFDERGEPAWHLPVGAAGTPLTRFSGANLWDIMGRLAHTIGYLLYFNNLGHLQFHKYRGYFNPPESDIVIHAQTVHHAQLMRDLNDVRNSVTLVGIDAYAPLQLPLVSHRIDRASIEDPRSPNYLGYHAPFVWADSQFARDAFIARAADAIAQVFFSPNRQLVIRTHLSPHIFPGYGLRFAEPLDRWDIADRRWLIVGVQHHITNGTVGTTTIHCRQIERLPN